MGFLNNVAFFRMYVLLMIWTNFLAMLFLAYKPQEDSKKYYFLLAIIMIGGMLTQYYFIIYACFACIIYALQIIIAKHYKKLKFSIISVFSSVIIVSCIYPAMWKHIFIGSRGKEAFNNLTANNPLESICKYLNIINTEVFGKLFIALFVIIVLFIFMSMIKNKLNKDKINMYIQLLLPVMLYIIVIAIISPYKTDRYVFNIMGLLYLGVFSILINTAVRFHKKAIIGILLIALLCIICGSFQQGIPYLYRNKQENIITMQNLGANTPCLYFYQKGWKTLPDFMYLTSIDKIIFTDLHKIELNTNYNKDLHILKEARFKDSNKILVFIDNKSNQDDIIERLLNDNSQLNHSQKLFISDYTSAYLLTK